jgi:CelD/BcsL family acetyltransferase involved in cellulose biosynthesis
MITTDVIDDLEGLSQLATDWARLGERFPTPLLQFEWFLSCAEALYKPGQLYIVVLKDQDRIIAIAPLAKAPRQFAQWLEIMGVTRLQEPSGLLYESQEALRRLLRVLTDSRYPLDLGRLSADSPLLPTPSVRAKRNGIWIRRPGAPRSMLELDKGWESTWGEMSKSRRADFRRLERRAASQGGFELEVVQPEPSEFEAVFSLAVEIEASGWKRRRGSCLKENLQLYAFFKHYCRRMALRSALYVFFLRLGGTPVAMHLAVRFAGCLWILKIGYDDRFRSLSPGLYLALQTIRHSCAEGLKGYEFLGAEEPWQHAWSVESMTHGSGVFLPYGIRGGLGMVDIVASRMPLDCLRSSPQESKGVQRYEGQNE